MITLILSSFCLANDIPGEEVWVAKPKLESQINLQHDKSKPKIISKKLDVMQLRPGNLPIEYYSVNHRESTASELIQPPKGAIEIYQAIKIGDVIDLTISHSIIAFPDERSPVVGVAKNKNYSGLKLIGESYLEKNSKRIFVNFTKLVKGHQTFEIKGIGISSVGQPGLSGEYHSREAEYFTGDFVSSFAAGYFDGLVPRHTNAFGQIESDPTVDSAVKKGLASGALSTAERFKEKLKRIPEFSEIMGPFEMQVLILEEARVSK